MSFIRFALLLLLALPCAAALGKSSEVVSGKNGLDFAGYIAVDADAPDETDGSYFSRPGTLSLHSDPLFGMTTSPEIVPAVEVRTSDSGNSDKQGGEVASESDEDDSSSSVPGALVALIFAAFGLLLVTRRKHSHRG